MATEPGWWRGGQYRATYDEHGFAYGGTLLALLLTEGEG